MSASERTAMVKFYLLLVVLVVINMGCVF